MAEVRPELDWRTTVRSRPEKRKTRSVRYVGNFGNRGNFPLENNHGILLLPLVGSLARRVLSDVKSTI